MAQVQCRSCEKVFEARQKELNRGFGKYCSIGCSNRSRKKQPRPNVECALCGTAFFKKEAHKAGSKSGLFFCCRAHKDIAQRIGGLEAIQPGHYGLGGSHKTYRKIAFRAHGKICNRCEYEGVPGVLEVHHVNRDRSNNAPENLEVLCPTCHRVEHFQKGDGPFNRGTGSSSNGKMLRSQCRDPGSIPGDSTTGM